MIYYNHIFLMILINDAKYIHLSNLFSFLELFIVVFACMLIFIRRRKMASFKVYIKVTYKVHIQRPHKQSPYKVHGIYRISSTTFISFFHCVYALPNRIGGFRLRDERRKLSALSAFSTDFPYLFLSNCYYRYLNGHPSH